MITERYGLKTFEEDDLADLANYSKTMNDAIIEALDNNTGEKGDPGEKGEDGLGVPSRRNNRTNTIKSK